MQTEPPTSYSGSHFPQNPTAQPQSAVTNFARESGAYSEDAQGSFNSGSRNPHHSYGSGPTQPIHIPAASDSASPQTLPQSNLLSVRSGGTHMEPSTHGNSVPTGSQSATSTASSNYSMHELAVAVNLPVTPPSSYIGSTSSSGSGFTPSSCSGFTPFHEFEDHHFTFWTKSLIRRLLSTGCPFDDYPTPNYAEPHIKWVLFNSNSTINPREIQLFTENIFGRYRTWRAERIQAVRECVSKAYGLDSCGSDSRTRAKIAAALVNQEAFTYKQLNLMPDLETCNNPLSADRYEHPAIAEVLRLILLEGSPGWPLITCSELSEPNHFVLVLALTLMQIALKCEIPDAGRPTPDEAYFKSNEFANDGQIANALFLYSFGKAQEFNPNMANKLEKIWQHVCGDEYNVDGEEF